MKAFLSHSSKDKALVIAIHDAIEKDSTWLDRAEIEWGDLFLEKIADGMKSATDFVLFWSESAAESGWVRLEINMAFVLALKEKAIRLRVVALDKTPLPLYLRPFHCLSVSASADPVDLIVEKLTSILREPIGSVRARFVDRNHEIARIEGAVDDPQLCGIWLCGFTGVGKASLVRESIRRIFEGADPIKIEVTEGTGFVELAMTLNAAANRELPPESLNQKQLEREIRLSIEMLAKEGRLWALLNVQHWLNEEGEPEEPLSFLLAIIRGISVFVRRPVFLTSTRRPQLDSETLSQIEVQTVRGLEDEYIAALVRNWHFVIYGLELEPEEAKRIAPRLFGHPVAARLVAGLLGDHSVDYLEKYPHELISLRRDLARVLLRDMRLSPPAERLMEILALAGIALPASTIAATGFSDDDFQQAVGQCTRAGLITADLKIQGHPLFQEFFWHRLHRSDYQSRALELARTLRNHLSGLGKDSPEYAELLPVTFRLFALGGEFETATAMRRDLMGELSATAITLYNRRNYNLADRYIGHVLEGDPANWTMRLYKARIRVRQEQWAEAESIISGMLTERPGDVAVLHCRGWMRLRQNKLEEALAIFADIISRKEHLASLRNAAECLHRLKRNSEALTFVARAKTHESENPFLLDMESRILEDMEQLQPAYESAWLAAARDPLNAHLQHRLGQICIKMARTELSIQHFDKAVELDSDFFSPALSLASAYLDLGDARSAEELVPQLDAKARTPGDRALAEHVKARIAFVKNDLSTSEAILKREIASSRNLLPNLGLLAQVELALFDENQAEFPTIADVALNSAEHTVERIVELDGSNKFAEGLRGSIKDRRSRLVR